MRVPFGTQSYVSPALSLSAQRLVNARAIKADPQSKTPLPVFRCPGIRTFKTFDNPIRGAAIINERLVVVSGTDVYDVSETGFLTNLGTIPGTETTPSASGVGEAVFLADGAGYVVDTAVTQITDVDFPLSTQVVWTDGYFVFLASDRVQVSAFNDPLLFDALAYDSLTWATEQPIAIIADTRDLIHFMPKAIAIGYNKGLDPYPFQLAPDGFIEIGCAAPRSPAKLDNTVFWLASDRTIRALRGTTPTRISTEPLEQLFATFEIIDDAYGMAISGSGSFSYIITFPSAGRTFEYNVATERWNERASYGDSYWHVRGTLDCYRRTFVWTDNQLGWIDQECYTEFDDPQVVVSTSPPVVDSTNWVHFDRVELDADMGVGLTTGQGSDPQVVLRYSDDGGKTWSADYQRPMGKIGETKARAVYTRLGRSRNRVFQVQYSEPTPFALYGAEINSPAALAA